MLPGSLATFLPLSICDVVVELGGVDVELKGGDVRQHGHQHPIVPSSRLPMQCQHIHLLMLLTGTLLRQTRRYEEDEERRERFYYTMLGGGGTPPSSACPDVARLVVQQHFNCPSAWCILPLQVWLTPSTGPAGEPALRDVLCMVLWPCT